MWQAVSISYQLERKEKKRSLWQNPSKILALIRSSRSHCLHWSCSWHPPRLVAHTHARSRAPPHSMTGAHVAMGAHHRAARPACHGLAAHGALVAISHSVSQSWHHCSHTSLSRLPVTITSYWLPLQMKNWKEEEEKRKEKNHQII